MHKPLFCSRPTPNPQPPTPKMKKHTVHVVLALLFGGVVYAAEKPSVDSSIVVVSIQSEIKAQPSAVLSIVKKAVKLHPSWSGEIVKAAIRASNGGYPACRVNC